MEAGEWPRGLIIVKIITSLLCLGEQKARKTIPDDDSFIAVNDQVDLTATEQTIVGDSRQEQETSFDMLDMEKYELEVGFKEFTYFWVTT